jgi:hypothetical protein
MQDYLTPKILRGMDFKYPYPSVFFNKYQCVNYTILKKYYITIAL